MNKTKKKKTSKLKSYQPTKVVTDVKGNKNTSSMSYSRKKIQISRNCIGTLTGFWVVGRNPHS